MACSLTSDYPDYLASIVRTIEAGNDETLKACACNLRAFIDVNKKRYFLPACVYNPVNHPELYNEVLNAGMPLLPVDPQKIMELFFKYKSFDVNLSGNKDEAGEYNTSCEEAGDDNPNQGTWNETVPLIKAVGRLEQVCQPTPFFFGNSQTLGMDCAADEELLPYGANVPGFNQFLLFFMQPYVEPECDQPGPTLYLASLTGISGPDAPEYDEASFNNVTLAIYTVAIFGGVSNPQSW